LVNSSRIGKAKLTVLSFRVELNELTVLSHSFDRRPAALIRESPLGGIFVA
jgi:hypothetical protein